MKRSFPASLMVLVGAFQPAFADEAASSRWIGPYIGAHAGYGHGSTDFSTRCGGPDCQDFGDFDLEGFAGGAYAGYNFAALNRIILGVEADVSFSSIDGDAFFGGKNATAEFDAIGSIRGRVGVLLRPDFMVYATGGVAFADLSTSFTIDGPLGPRTFSWSDLEVGWTIGGGAEQSLTKNLSLRVEYLYYDFGSSSHGWDYEFVTGTAHFDTDLHVVRAGLTYKFD